MAESTQSETTIAADPTEVLDIIADFEAYPQWADQVKQITVVSEDADGWPKEVEFVLDAGVIKDTYTLAYDWDVIEAGTGVVSWHLVKSTMLKAMNGSYDLSAGGDGTTVVYSLNVDLAVPVIGMLRRKAEKMIIDTALKGLKKRAEAK